jgi:hypothetical protein
MQLRCDQNKVCPERRPEVLTTIIVTEQDAGISELRGLNEFFVLPSNFFEYFK